MNTINRLKKEARESAISRGHTMSHFHCYGQFYVSYCSECDMSVQVTPNPLPNQIQIGGNAVALNCNKKVKKNTREYFDSLVKKGDIVQCSACWQYSAYAWEDTNIMANTISRLTPEDGLVDGGELYTEEEYLPAWPDVYHIPSASGDEWECGMCHTHWMEEDSPLNSPCYTHNEEDKNER